MERGDCKGKAVMVERLIVGEEWGSVRKGRLGGEGVGEGKGAKEGKGGGREGERMDGWREVEVVEAWWEGRSGRSGEV